MEQLPPYSLIKRRIWIQSFFVHHRRNCSEQRSFQVKGGDLDNIATFSMTLNLLFILLMFLVTCGAELCEPVAKSRCCDPLVWVFCFLKIFSFFGINYFAECLKYDRVLIPDMICHCYCRTAVTATPSTPSTRTSRSAPRCSTSAGGGAADGRLCGSARTVTPLKVEMTHGDMRTIGSNKEGKMQILFCISVLPTALSIVKTISLDV